MAQVVSKRFGVVVYLGNSRESFEIEAFRDVVFVVKKTGYMSTIIYKDMVCEIETRHLRIVESHSNLLTRSKYFEAKEAEALKADLENQLKIDRFFQGFQK